MKSFPFIKCVVKVTFHKLSPLIDIIEPVSEELFKLNILSPSVEHFGFDIKFLVKVLHPPYSLQNQVLLLTFLRLESAIQIITVIALLFH
jgi:hypothetical protein